jgi:hypothetical protein
VPQGLRPFYQLAAEYVHLVASATPRVVSDTPETTSVLSEAGDVTVYFKTRRSRGELDTKVMSGSVWAGDVRFERVKDREGRVRERENRQGSGGCICVLTSLSYARRPNETGCFNCRCVFVQVESVKLYQDRQCAELMVEGCQDVMLVDMASVVSGHLGAGAWGELTAGEVASTVLFASKCADKCVKAERMAAKYEAVRHGGCVMYPIVTRSRRRVSNVKVQLEAR